MTGRGSAWSRAKAPTVGRVAFECRLRRRKLFLGEARRGPSRPPPMAGRGSAWSRAKAPTVGRVAFECRLRRRKLFWGRLGGGRRGPLRWPVGEARGVGPKRRRLDVSRSSAGCAGASYSGGGPEGAVEA